ncbi:hypothetical protein GKQ77_19950 [Streptomyces sp. BG9H]|uniref:Secreted protein n=2 Tax=Streptomyces anatolicus TaxID=2675858 RepID=A0ABS6YR13_9ACTN|nr:hypothetical protein [Streptomyces anatolicus]
MNSHTRPVATAKKLGLLAAVTVCVLSLAQCSGDSSDRGRTPSREHREPPSATAPPPGLEREITAYTAAFDEDSGYRRPSRTDRKTVAAGVGLLLDGRRDEAERRLSDVDFAIRTVTDEATGRRYAEIADRAESGSAPRGWGRVYVDLDSPVRWSAQVPHPVADRHTERLGAQLLSRAPGGVLIVAGAHRKAGRGDQADVAHRRDSVFHAVCDELVRRGLPGVQLHGMAEDSAPDHDVVASTGRGREAVTEGRALADDLKRRGYDVCRAWARSCPLAGRTNVQGRAATARDVPFLHVEFGPRLREDRDHAGEAVAALADVTRTWRRG